MPEGFHDFTAGDVLTAAQLDDYLMSQALMRFDNATARDSALTSPVEGMHAYLKDTNSITVYSGSAWVEIARTAPVEVRLTRLSGLSISATTATTITWDTEDTDPYGFITVSGTTLTVPTGLGGLYVMTAGGSATSGNQACMRVGIGGGFYYGGMAPVIGGTVTPSATWLFRLAAGATLTFGIYNADGSSRTFNAALTMLRLAP